MNVNAIDNQSIKVLNLATPTCQAKSVQLLLKNGASTYHKNNLYRYPLHWAAFSGNIELVKFLLSFDEIEVNAVDVKKNLPIHYAVVNKHIEVIKLLIQNGSDLNKLGESGTPLCMAVHDGDLNIIKLLVEGGANINLPEYYDDERLTPLRIAFRLNNMKIVSYLFDKVPCSIHNLAKWGTVKHIAQFIKPNDVNSVDERLHTPLFYALEKPENVKYLISLGSNINHYDKFNKTPIFHAIVLECVESVEILIKEGCELNYKERNHGYTPLICAILLRNFELFKLLVGTMKLNI